VNKKENKQIENEKEDTKKECFVIMPISDKDEYAKGHFKRVYEDIFKPAIEKAGFKPYRADDSNSSNLIQIDIVKRIIKAPMAICDLSTRNPNVLFELGIRQAFDKPVLLVQETGTERIFDISSINTYDYKKERIYNEVLEDQEKISYMLKDTFEKHNKGECVNSLLRLINIEPAENKGINVGSDEMMKVIFNEVMGIKMQLNEQLSYNKNLYSALDREHSDELYINELIKIINLCNEEYICLIQIKNEIPKQEYIKRLEKLDEKLFNTRQKLRFKNIPIMGELIEVHSKINHELSSFIGSEA